MAITRVKLRPGIKSIWLPPSGKATCQVCARKIGAKNGLIAHHGYERPEFRSGWQTASCYGARQRPFETHRDVLLRAIKAAEAYRERLLERRDELAAGKPSLEVSHVYHLYDYKSGAKHLKIATATAATFEEVHAAHHREFTMCSIRSFKDLVDRTAREVDYKIKQNGDELHWLNNRYNSWIPIPA